ncbi:hypothetical protein [Candidatus Rariloculus sp.]|uniref:hypothetical protein n=1 Tax=Candidatus Rariloculus sp. TaxID=3101265 RepID=UPI003D12F7D6
MLRATFYHRSRGTGHRPGVGKEAGLCIDPRTSGPRPLVIEGSEFDPLSGRRVDDLRQDGDRRIIGYTGVAGRTPRHYGSLYIDQDECTRCGRRDKIHSVESISIWKATRNVERASDVRKRLESRVSKHV